jgi:nodulation protein E
MPSVRRVVITGAGIVCALGQSLGEVWAGMKEGRCGIIPLPPGHDLRFQNAAQAASFDAKAHLDAKLADSLDRFAQLGLAAAKQAVSQSGLMVAGSRTAVVTGTSAGGQGAIDAGFVDLYKLGSPRVNPLTIPKTMANSAASQIGMMFGITGPSWAVSTACSSANHAIGQAFWLVRAGIADAAITGGCEAPLNPGFLKAWEAMRVVAPDTCRPFSKDRKGMILGEGAGMFVIETLDSARARGAVVLAEIAGFGMNADAHHLTMPSPEGAAAAMRMALADAAIEAGQIGYLNAHGTGTPANDPAETKAIRAVFGDGTDRLAVSSTKSMHGHALGAAGALEAAAVLLALNQGVLPPTVNYTGPDPECDLDVVPNRARAAQVEMAMSNSFAFGGLNAVLVFRSPAAL